MSQENAEGQEKSPELPATDPELGEDIRPASKGRKGRQRGTEDSFIGRAAQMAVMAELLQLHCNVAIPEVDLGTDVFVFKDDREEVVRLQVKACTVPRIYLDGSGFSAKFSLPMRQIRRGEDRPPLYYALAVLRDRKWADFIVVSRSVLFAYYNGSERFGYFDQTNDDLVLTIGFRDQVKCSKQDLTKYRNAWTLLPPLQPKLDLGLT